MCWQKPTVDIKPALYELLHELLQNNWRYFFKDSVLTVLKSSQNDENVENQQQFIDIMQVSGSSVLHVSTHQMAWPVFLNMVHEF